ncbi:MAG: diaminopimelate epimerase [Phycisphaerales bacterium]|nr:diaminopimelate epimerase [Phycisphaerales bacterium]
MTLRFEKWEGLGNDYLLVDRREFGDRDPNSYAVRWSDRNFGVGSDGLILVDDDPLAMQIFNADGSEGAMCGNGIRAVAAQFARRSGGLWSGVVSTKSGDRQCKVLGLEDSGHDMVTVNMGSATITALPDGLISPFPGVHVDVGNPHYVAFVSDCEAVMMQEIGPKIETASVFPDRINVQIASDPQHGRIRLRTWERGSGVTKACGTGACAVAAAYFAKAPGQDTVTLDLDGGSLKITQSNNELWMTGPARCVYAGVVSD